MKALVLVLLVAVLAAVVWSLSGDRLTAGRASDTAASATATSAAGSAAPPAVSSSGDSAMQVPSAAREPGPAEVRDRSARAAGDPVALPAVHGTLAWPRRAAAKDSARVAPAAVAGEPPVAVELAFQALRRVGTDAQAERTWRRAIDDPRTPEGTRSDLIEDLNQEGFTDNSRPTKADLPLILARLELIERLLPVTTDASNRASFEEAYKDLLAMYVRLGGAPRATVR